MEWGSWGSGPQWEHAWGRERPCWLHLSKQVVGASLYTVEADRQCLWILWYSGDNMRRDQGTFFPSVALVGVGQSYTVSVMALCPSLLAKGSQRGGFRTGLAPWVSIWCLITSVLPKSRGPAEKIWVLTLYMYTGYAQLLNVWIFGYIHFQ